MVAPASAPQWVAEAGSARQVAIEVLRHGPLSRVELARRTGLSPGSLTRLTKPLLADGVLVEADTDRRDGGLGRPALPLDVVADRVAVAGVNITGSTAYAVRTDLRARIVAAGRAELSDRAPHAVVETVAELVDGLGPADAVGVSIGGHSPDGRVVRHAPFLDWTDVPLGPLLAERTGRHAVVANDVVAFAAGEHWFGAAAGLRDFALITVGAGVGYGLVVHDRLVQHPDAGIGLLGHHPLDPAGPLCPEGHRGCARAMLTTDALTSQASMALGRDIDRAELMRLAEQGEPVAVRLVRDAAHALGRLVAAVANIAMPARVLLGGEGVSIAEVGADALRAGISARRDPRARPVDVAIVPGGRSRWARGAAAVAVQDLVFR